MPLNRRTEPDGSITFLRPAYDAASYTVSSKVIPTIQSWGDRSVYELLEDREGPLSGRWYVIDHTEHDGKKWLVLQHILREWCLEVEDSGLPISDIIIRPVPPERAWDYALAEDAKGTHRVVHDGW